MSFAIWQKWLTRRPQPSQRRAPAPRRCRPRLEALEDRTAPAVLTVNTTGDSPDPAHLNLRLALQAVNNQSTAGLTSQQLAQVSGTLGSNDRIPFAPGVAGTITLQQGELDILRSVEIDGPGASSLIIDAHGQSRVLAVPNASSTVTLQGLTLTRGQGGHNSGGGIDNFGKLTVNVCTLSGNSADFGGGIDNEGGTLTVTGCTLSRNFAEAGAGIDNFGTLTVANSTLSGDSARVQGGGIDNFGTLTVANSTLSGNSASLDGGGLENTGTLTLTNCTLAGNSAFGGGGLFNAGGALSLANTLVAANAASFAPDVAGTLTSLGHNLFGTGASGAGPNDLVGTAASPLDPLLAPLGNYGGPTATMALRPGSLAIDHGDNARAVGPDGAPLTADQRGFARISNGTVDIGAFEVQNTFITLAPGEGVRLQRDATVPTLLDITFTNSTRPGFSLDTTTLPAITIVGSANNRVDVEDLPAGIGLTIQGGTGSMSVDVTPAFGNLDHIQGPLFVYGGSGPLSLTLNDQSGPTTATDVLTASSYRRANFGGLTYANVGTLTVSVAPGIALGNYQSSQNVIVTGTPAGTATTIHAASGANNITVGLPTDPAINTTGLPGSPLDNLHGPLTLNGDSQDNLTLWDWDSSTAQKTYANNANSIAVTNLNGVPVANPVPIRWQGNLSVAALYGSAAADTYQLLGKAGNLAALVVNGYYRANTFQSFLPKRTWAIYANQAVGNYVPGQGAIDLGEVWNFTGGPGGDTFTIARNYGQDGGLGGVLDGGGPGAWLDYSQNVGPVTVNLATGQATGIGGGIRNIRHVIGSRTADNTLTGNSLGNILIGGAGNNTLTAGGGNSLLIGGSGAEHLVASSGTPGFDILIAGTTDFDSPTATDLSILEAFFSVWRNTTAGNYAGQVGQLRDSGVVVGGSTYRLNSSTVHAHRPGAAAVLEGATASQAALDWFFASAAEVRNLKTGEVVTPIT
jgi:hypothetical protein